MRNKWWLISLLFALAVVQLSCNPFAPSYDEDGLIGNNLLGDRTTIDGVFTFFKNSYELRDTSLYGKLFAEDFTFTYRDFDQNANVSWDKETELAISYNLFRGVQNISLDWNYYVDRDTTATEAFVTRNFSLTIVENENSIFTGTGRARLALRRNTPADPWLIYDWFDDSDF